jgi:hypothetical protein
LEFSVPSFSFAAQKYKIFVNLCSKVILHLFIAPIYLLRQVQPKTLPKFVLACWLAEKKTVARNTKKGKDVKAAPKNKLAIS